MPFFERTELREREYSQSMRLEILIILEEKNLVLGFLIDQESPGGPSFNTGGRQILAGRRII